MVSSSTTLPDVELVELARLGDRSAFDELLRRHDPRMRALAYRLMADRHRMDDALQEAYLRAFRALPRFRGDARVSTWLFRITYNACLDELARARKTTHVPLDEVVEQASDPFELDDALEARGEIARQFAELAPDERAVVFLVDVEGFDYAAASRILGIPVGTVKTHVLRGKAKLKARLAGKEETK